MRILLITLIGLLLSNCTSNSYVKNKKIITSPDDLQKFVNVYCNKNKQTDRVIKVCGNGWSKDLNISESKAVLSAKIKIADITQHSIVSNEVITHKENNKGIVKTYDLTADSKLEDVSILDIKSYIRKFLKRRMVGEHLCKLNIRFHRFAEVGSKWHFAKEEWKVRDTDTHLIYDITKLSVQ